MWYLTATILMIFLRTNLPNFVQAYRYDTSRQGSDGMIITRPGKCRYSMPSHTVPLRALLIRQTGVRVKSTNLFKREIKMYLAYPGPLRGGQGGKLPRAQRQRRSPVIPQNEFFYRHLGWKQKLIIQILIFLNCATTFLLQGPSERHSLGPNLALNGPEQTISSCDMWTC